jgi:hypothetical protein
MNDKVKRQRTYGAVIPAPTLPQHRPASPDAALGPATRHKRTDLSSTTTPACEEGHHHCYTDAVTWIVMDATRSQACQAMTRVRYFLQGDKSAIVAQDDGHHYFRPQNRTAKDEGMVTECVPCVRGHILIPPLGLSPKSFRTICRCAVCGVVQLLQPRSHRRGAADDVIAAIRRQGDAAPPHRLRCCMCMALPKGHPPRHTGQGAGVGGDGRGGGTGA